MAEVVKLRSKIVKIEAMQFTGGAENATPIINWVLENGGTARYHEYRTHDTSVNEETGVEHSYKRNTPSPEHISIDTLEGTMRASVGDWIFRGLEGEFYPCKDSVKVAKYDEVTDAD